MVFVDLSEWIDIITEESYRCSWNDNSAFKLWIKSSKLSINLSENYVKILLLLNYESTTKIIIMNCKWNRFGINRLKFYFLCRAHLLMERCVTIRSVTLVDRIRIRTYLFIYINYWADMTSICPSIDFISKSIKFIKVLNELIFHFQPFRICKEKLFFIPL